MSESAIDANATVSHEQDGRVLSGVGVTSEQLAETMDRHTPDETAVVAAVPASESAAAEVLQPKPTKGQARFSELTHARDEAKRIADEATARATAAERKAADLEARLTQPQQREPEPQRQQPAPQPTRPKPTLEMVGEGLPYPNIETYFEDLAEWKLEQRQDTIDQRIRSGIEADRSSQALNAHVETTRAKGRAVYTDFDTVMQQGPGAAITAQMPAAAQQFIWQQPHAEHLVYAILRDAALAQKLTMLSVTHPAAFGLELAKLAPAAPAASSASTGTPGSVTPPAPIQPVGAGSKTTSLSSADHAERGDYQAYKAARTAERGGPRRR